MSASNRPEDLDEPSKYAPKWVREGNPRPFAVGTRRLPAAPQLVVSDAPEPPSGAPSRQSEGAFEGDLAIKRMRMQRSLEPERITEPQWREPARFPFGMILRTVAALAIATAGALVYVGVLPLPFGQALSVATVQEPAGTEARAPDQSVASRPTKMNDRVGELRIPQTARPQPAPAAPAPAQTVARLEEPAPNTVQAPSSAQVPGLKPWPQATPSWPQPATAPVAVAPPAAAPVPAKPAAAAPVAPTPAPVVAALPPAAAPAPTTGLRQLDPDEVETLIRRGEAFVKQGDIAAGRLMLKRAAEAGSSRAALSLGGTYDPDELRKLGVLGFQADAAQARRWYEKAAALGSAEASRRLAGLAR